MDRTSGTAPVGPAFLKALHVTTQRVLQQAAALAEVSDLLVERVASLEEQVYNAYITSTAYHRAGSGSSSEADLGSADRHLGDDRE